MNEFRYKQAIVFRSDIALSKGKIAAQAGHAAVSAAKKSRKEQNDWWRKWIKEGQCKIILKVSSEEQLRELERHAKELSIPAALVIDRGLTEIPPGTVTCLGIGPAPARMVDGLTGKLSLL